MCGVKAGTVLLRSRLGATAAGGGGPPQGWAPLEPPASTRTPMAHLVRLQATAANACAPSLREMSCMQTKAPSALPWAKGQAGRAAA